MKKWWQSRSHRFTVVALPALSYALLNIDTLGLSPVAATYAGIALTVATMAGNAYLRQITNKGIE